MKTIERSKLANAAKKLLKSLGIAVGIVLVLLFMTPTTNNEAMAAGSDSQQGNGKMMKGGQGGGSHGDHATGSKSGAKGVKDAVLADEGDDDSDRPPWAGGNPDLNIHSGGGGGKPDGAGTMKGDLYGDLIVVLRDPDTGMPEPDAEYGFVQPIVTWPYEQALEEDGSPIFDDEGFPVFLDEDGEPVYDPNENTVYKEGLTTLTIQLDEEGEVPTIYEPYLQEVEFGRAAVARSPDKVTEKALTDALSKLTTEGVVLDTDPSGRISYTVDGVTYTIDSPLENLALYIDLMTGLASNETTQTEDALGILATLDTAASLLAAVGDKTGNVSLDYVMYYNIITGVVDSGSYYSYSDFTYTRDYDDYTYFYMDGADVKSATLDIKAYLDSINGELTSEIVGATLFAAATNDAVEVIELIHTQIHEALLPGTVTP